MKCCQVYHKWSSPFPPFSSRRPLRFCSSEKSRNMPLQTTRKMKKPAIEKTRRRRLSEYLSLSSQAKIVIITTKIHTTQYNHSVIKIQACYIKSSRPLLTTQQSEIRSPFNSSRITPTTNKQTEKEGNEKAEEYRPRGDKN